jgi:hypothetical protein
MTVSQRVAGWLRQRLGGPLFGSFLTRNVPDETGLPHTLGSATFFLLVVQVVTGIVLALNYSPTPEHAYDSVAYIMTAVLFGPAVRGLHHWGGRTLWWSWLASTWCGCSSGDLTSPRGRSPGWQAWRSSRWSWDLRLRDICCPGRNAHTEQLLWGQRSWVLSL